MKSYLGVARANFLLLPVTLVAVGAAAAACDGAFDLVTTIAALLGLVALHAAVNAFNEYSDFRRGIDLETERTPFSGGSGTLPGGEPARIALGVGIGGSVFGIIVGIYFLYIHWPSASTYLRSRSPLCSGLYRLPGAYLPGGGLCRTRFGDLAGAGCGHGSGR